MAATTTGILGRKVGCTQVFDPERGAVVPVTVIRAGPCRVAQVKRRDRDGYSAVQLGFEETKPHRLTRPVLGHLRQAGLPPMRVLKEIRLVADPSWKVGDTLTVEVLAGVKNVDVTGTTKGRGFAGCIKRWGFQRGPESHGSKNVREPGSVGGKGRVPAKVVKGKRMPGHAGHARRTVRNLPVVGVDPERNVLLVKGAVPGPDGGLVVVRAARGE